jgi:hypothetical protein
MERRTLIAVATHGVSSGAFSRRAADEAVQSEGAISLPTSIPISFISPDHPNHVHDLVHIHTVLRLARQPYSFTITNHARRGQKDDDTRQRVMGAGLVTSGSMCNVNNFWRLLALALCLILTTTLPEPIVSPSLPNFFTLRAPRA